MLSLVSIKGRLMRKKILSGLVIFLLIFNARAQFTNVDVKMQSGETRPLMEVPWFQYQINIYESQYASKASMADWIVYSPPKFCPISSWFYVRWQGNITESDHSNLKKQCDDRMFKEKLANLSDQVKSVCSCRLVLKTESTANLANRKALWLSFDDELLNDDSFKIVGDLIDSASNKTSVLLTIGGNLSGIFSFDGTQLCKYGGNENVSSETGIKKLMALLGSKTNKEIPISCLPNKNGFFDMSTMSYSVWSRKIIGDMKITFDNGEIYGLKIRQ